MKISGLVLVLALSVFISYCSKTSPHAGAYGNCVKQIMEQSNEKNQGKIPEDMNRQLAEAACKIVKTECEKDPDGPVCKSLQDKYK